MKFKSIVISALVGVLIISCGSDEGDSPDNSLSNEETFNVVEKSSNAENSVDWITDRYLAGLNVSGAFTFWKNGLADCTEISQTPTENGRMITVNFGEACNDEYGNTYSGIIHLNVINQDTLTRIEKTFTNFTFNNYAITGEINSDVFNTDFDGDGELERAAYRESDIVITNPDGVSNTRTANFFIVRTEGVDNDPSVSKVFRITGNATNALSNGNTWNMTINSPIIRPQSCNYYAVSGNKTLVNTSNNRSFFVDFGDGDCDGVIEVTLPSGEVIQVNQY